MAGRASAFAVLGLEPGADPASVERAYKRLIKQHHPDREGGDASRAAEINRAYRELRGGRAATDPLQFNEELNGARGRLRWPTAALIACAAAAAVLYIVSASAPLPQPISAASAQLSRSVRAAANPTRGIGDDLHLREIDAAVSEALQLYRTKDEMALAALSRNCHQRFRQDPGTVLLDRCAAFDDAVVGLQDRDPLRDGGPFAPLAVTGRQWSAASQLSGDYLAIDGRLDRIRLRVELALAPQMEPAEPAKAD